MLHQIWTDEPYVYAATSSGLDIIDIATEQRQSFATNSSGYTTVWSSSTQVFLGSSAGVKVLNKQSIGPLELSSKVTDYVRVPRITSDDIRYIHGNEDKLICCTAEGVDTVHRPGYGVSSTSVSGANKCFVTHNYDHFYYTVSGVDWQLCRIDYTGGGWTTPDVVYTTGSGFLENSTRINDIYVTGHTSVSGVNNTIFLAADDAVYVYDEDSKASLKLTTAFPLAGTSSNYTSVWADSFANIETGSVYVGTTGSGAALSVYNLEHSTLTDSYLIDQEGSTEEFLDAEDIVDININIAGS